MKMIQVSKKIWTFVSVKKTQSNIYLLILAFTGVLK